MGDAWQYVSRTNTAGISEIVIVKDADGAYIYVYKTDESEPDGPRLYSTVELAQLICLEDYGTPLDSWSLI